MLSRIKKAKKKYWQIRTWIKEFGLPNIYHPRKLFRAFVWNFLPGYKKYPPFVITDPIVNCNLKCPLCSIPPRDLPHYGARLTLRDFEKYFHKIKDSTNMVGICHAGEPFLNTQLFDMVEVVNQAGLISNVGTNGTLLTEKNINRIFDSGLDILQISFDGFSKETYEKYRVGADFDKVLAGVTALAGEKKKRKSLKPFITVTFLINAYNKDEIEAAREYFTGLGLSFVPKGINLNVHRRDDGKTTRDLEHWGETETRYSNYRRDEKGGLVFKKPFKPLCNTCMKPVINCKGDILLCCHDIFNSVKLGNIAEIDFKKFWMSDKYRDIREKAAQRELPLCRVCGK